jgi:hypothetical protein
MLCSVSRSVFATKSMYVRTVRTHLLYVSHSQRIIRLFILPQYIIRYSLLWYLRPQFNRILHSCRLSDRYHTTIPDFSVYTLSTQWCCSSLCVAVYPTAVSWSSTRSFRTQLIVAVAHNQLPILPWLIAYQSYPIYQQSLYLLFPVFTRLYFHLCCPHWLLGTLL